MQSRSETSPATPAKAGAAIVLFVATVICFIFWPEWTAAAWVIVFGIIGMFAGGPLGCLGGGVIALVIFGILYGILFSLGWQPPSEAKKQAEIAKARMEYVSLSEQLDRQPVVDAGRRELIWEIWEKNPGHACSLIEAATAQPPRIPTTRELTAALETYLAAEEYPGEKTRRAARWDVEDEKRRDREKLAQEAQDRQMREREKLKREISKCWEIYSLLQNKDPACAKQLSARMPTAQIYQYPQPGKLTHEELLAILEGIEKQEAERLINHPLPLPPANAAPQTEAQP